MLASPPRGGSLHWAGPYDDPDGRPIGAPSGEVPSGLAGSANGASGAGLRPASSTGRPEQLWVVALGVPFLEQCGLPEFRKRYQVSLQWPKSLRRLIGAAEPFRSVDTYELFATMTLERMEIVIQGSDDGVTWLPYKFRWKPGHPRARPRFCTPHLPRLDWQMWFAALGTARDNPWFTRFLGRLAEGSPEVLGLLRQNPFPDRPPRMLRAVLYDYRFTDSDGRRRSGTWWGRQLLGLYHLPLSLRPAPAAEPPEGGAGKARIPTGRESSSSPGGECLAPPWLNILEPIAMSFVVRQIDHVELFVRDPEAAARWYADVLGLAEVCRWDPEPVMIGVGGTKLALFRASAGEDKPSGGSEPHWHRVAWLTNAAGFEAAQAHLRARSIPFQGPMDHRTARSVYFEDPDGHPLEITYYL